MLCDDLLHKAVSIRDYVHPILPRIAAAPKFKLSPAFTPAACELSLRSDQLVKALPMCRLPFDECWFELHNADRLKWTTRPIAPDESPVKRVGFLVKNYTKSAFKIHLFWDYIQNGTLGFNTCFIAQLVDLETEPPQEHRCLVKQPSPDPMWNHISPTVSDIEPHKTLQLLHSKYGANIVEMAGRDWGSEVHFLLSTLALLNAQNAVEVEPVSKDTHNAKRSRKGQFPLSSHKVIHIHPRLQALASSTTGSDRHPLRAHMVRGHFKHRKSGLYWWSPFMRGDRNLGLVTKDYQLDQPGDPE